jgi:hypothetical protein
MSLDLRKPVAILFFLLGSLLAVFGWLSPGTHAEVAPGFNVNLVWGLAMMLFAVLLSIFSAGNRQKS